MHLIFERPKGRFKSNCNILALAWTPYYNEAKFRQAQLDHHQKLLNQWTTTGPIGGLNRIQAATVDVVTTPTPTPIASNGMAESQNSGQHDHGKMDQFGWLAIGNIGRLIGVTLTSLLPPPEEIDGRKPGGQENQSPGDLILLNDDNEDNCASNKQSNEITTINTSNNKTDGEDLQKINQMDAGDSKVRLPEDFEKIRPDRKCMRSNYNLRGHRDEIILVQWNEIYQKLATVDSKGNALIWCKANEKFTIQTPFYNRSKSVADFKWSNDGKTALICYTDSFILVGGSSGQRHWHSMLNLDDYHITCASWTPNDEQLLLGVSNGNVVLIDLLHSELTEMTLGAANIRTMCWNALLNLWHLDCPLRKTSSPGADLPHQPPRIAPDPPSRAATLENELTAPNDDELSSAMMRHNNPSAIVNRRRLSLNCALFCRHCPSTSQGVHNRDCNRRPGEQQSELQALQLQSQQQQQPADLRHELAHQAGNRRRSSTLRVPHKDILAIDFANNTIKLFDGGLSDPKPREIQVNLESYLMAWSSDGETLAVAGFNIYTSAPSVGYLRCKYLNSIKFYNQQGQLIYVHKMNFTRYPITALTWAHNDQRLFVATGPRLHCARVHAGIPSLGLLALSCLHRHTKSMDKADVLKNLLQKQLVTSILNWQSFNCPLEIQRPPSWTSNCSMSQVDTNQSDSNYNSDKSVCEAGLVPTSTRVFDTDGSLSSGNESREQQRAVPLTNNINVANYQLPAKLKAKIDQLFTQTLQQPYDEQLTLNDIAWHVPKNQQRHYCTLICYTHELPDIGCIGHQYKAQELVEQIKGRDSMSSSSTGLTDNQASDQYKIFVLYVEYQGSLIPILRARRIGFLKPEFVIFDPERAHSKYFQRHHKVSDISDHQLATRRRGDLEASGPSGSNSQQATRVLARDNPLANCNELHNPYPDIEAPSRLLSRQSTLRGESIHHRQTPINGATGATARSHPMLQDPYLIYLLNLSQQKAKRAAAASSNRACRLSTSQEARLAIERYKMLSNAASSNNASTNSHALAISSSSSTLKSLPETSELVRIRSNIWGTKFKLINVGNRMIGPRALLGSVIYKASILHLQPRQIFLNLKDMSNYCVLCSMHHHTKMESGRLRRREANCVELTKSNGTASTPNKVSLIDMPLTQIDFLATPVRTSSKRTPRSRNNHKMAPNRDRSASVMTREEGDKVILPVGDSIRIAPKLDCNQRYKFAGCEDTAMPSKRTHRIPPAAPAPGRATKQAPDSSRLDPHQNPIASTSQGFDLSQPFMNNNDILTLSLDQGDQVRVEMSSLGTSSTSREDPKRPESDERAMDDFLQANKTLKSIQTITKMIVDLSSRASQGDDQTRGRDHEDELLPSPVKMFKSVDERAPTRYIPPDTPVHRPHHRALNEKMLKSQSVSSTPVRMPASRRSRRDHHHTGNKLDLDPDCPLPPPPPSVPFRRKLSSSAKRFFDGSLRSLSGLGSMSGTGYTTSEDLDSEDCEALVQHRYRRKHNRSYREHVHLEPQRRNLSQPCSPMRNVPSERQKPSFIHKQSIDLANLRSQVVHRLRQSTSWMSSSEDRLEIDVDKRLEQRKLRREQRSESSTKRSRWVHKSALAVTNNQSKLGEPFGYTESTAFESSSSSSSESDSLPSSDDESLDFNTSEDERSEMNFINRAMIRTKLFRKSSRHSASARELNILGRGELFDDDPLDGGASRARNLDNRGHSSQFKRRKSKDHSRRRAKKSICRNSNCCCSREIKLNNRPPVWNEYSQVYQLDFGGRVTQESAKNLQIDFNGNLALQFGRIDKCTYTLDYKYPFNAVQAMSIALASLTQRLK